MTRLEVDADAGLATLEARLDEGSAGEGPWLWLTGAGISAESGIPTFRGEGGYWRVGSDVYRPETLATAAAFRRMPRDLWGWYLYRRAVCRSKEPNAAHRALAELEGALGDDFLLVTQNVDGLHPRAGSSLARTYEIHGDIDRMRCSRHDQHPHAPVPSRFDDFERDRRLTDDELEALRCENCGALMRPHVLWFDECYDEPLFRFESATRAALECRALFVVGTTGATNLPLRIGTIAARRGVPMVVIDPEPNPFSAWALEGRGVFLEGTAGRWVPEVVRRLVARVAR